MEILRLDQSNDHKKPKTYGSSEHSCPFCGLPDSVVVYQELPFSLIENKFPTFGGSYQTVLIETDSCGSDLSTYSIEYTTSLLRFSFRMWERFLNNPQYKSVAFFKNHGFHAGGSIAHPHMQIVGFYDLDFDHAISEPLFDGEEVYRNRGVTLNFSTQQLSSPFELNIVCAPDFDYRVLALTLQSTIRFVLDNLSPDYKSYNLAFHKIRDVIYIKVIPTIRTFVPLSYYRLSIYPTSRPRLISLLRSEYLHLNF